MHVMNEGRSSCKFRGWAKRPRKALKRIDLTSGIGCSYTTRYCTCVHLKEAVRATRDLYVLILQLQPCTGE